MKLVTLFDQIIVVKFRFPFKVTIIIYGWGQNAKPHVTLSRSDADVRYFYLVGWNKFKMETTLFSDSIVPSQEPNKSVISHQGVSYELFSKHYVLHY